MSHLGTHLPSRFGWVPTKIVGPLVMTNLAAAAAAAIAGSNSIAAFMEAATYTHALSLTPPHTHSKSPPQLTYLLAAATKAAQRHSRSHSCWSIDESASDDDAHQLIVELRQAHLILISPCDRSAATSSSQQARQLVGG